MRKFLVLVALAALVAQVSPVQAQDTDDGLHNVSLLKLGATAKGTGANFNKDWPPNKTLKAGRGRDGTIFDPFEGARIDIRLVIPVDIKAIELIGLTRYDTRQVSGIDIYVEGEKVKHAELEDAPGKVQRIELDAHGQHVAIVGTGGHPNRKRKDGSLGPRWGGFERIRVLSSTNVAEMMKAPDAYQVSAEAVNIAPTSGSRTAGQVKVYGQPRQTEGHPCTIWDQVDIDHYKSMLKTSKKLRQQYEGLKSAMDKRITRPTGVPQPIKGDDGKWQHLPSRQYGGTHNQLALDIANLGTVYVLSGEEKYAEYAKKILLDYADVFDKYAPGNRPGFNHDSGKCFDQRLGDATWLIQVARGYDLIYNSPSITPAERKHIEDDLVKASAKFIYANRAVMISATNWSAICTTAVLIAGYATDDEDLIHKAMYWKGTKDDPKGGVMLHFSDRSIDADGMWAEGAMGYQFMAMQALIADAEILWHHGIDMYRHRDGALKRLFDSPLEFAYPDLKTPAIHDSGHGSIVGRESYLYEFGYRRYRDPKYLLILDQAGMHLDAQFQQFPVSILYDRDPDAETAAVEWESVNLFGVGYGILRNTTVDRTISLLMDYGPNRSHGHPDKLNIDLWIAGDRLIPDPGSVWYEQPIYRNWYHTTVSHNTLNVDELQQMACDGIQLVYGPADSMGIQRAWTDQAYAGVTMDRSLFLTEDYVADIFGAFARLPRKMDLCWHFRDKMEEPSGDALAFEAYSFPEPAERGYNSLDNVRKASADKPYTLSFTRKDGFVSRLSSICAEPTEVIVGDGYLGLQRPPTVIQRRQGNQTLYGNVIELTTADGYRARPARLDGSLDAGYACMQVTSPDGHDLCFAAFRPGVHSAEGVKTDAQQAFVRTSDDGVYAMYLGGGTSLQYKGVRLERGAPGLAYCEKAETGAIILGNPSPEKAVVTLAHPELKGMAAYLLDSDGKRTGELPGSAADGGAQRRVEIGAASRVEFAPEGAPSVYEHRQQMLRKRQEEQAAALAKAENEARARTALREKAAAANPLPKGTIVVVQAEDMTGQGGGKVGIGSRKRAAIGDAFWGWDGVGHWLEYTVDVPAEGYYNLTLCYCSALALCERQLEVNGELQEPFAPLIFPGTGGWANGSDDWQLYTAPNPVAEHPLLIKLKKGKNVLRLTNTNGRGVNLDYLAVHSPDVNPTREMLAGKLAK